MIGTFLSSLAERNAPLYYSGWICIAGVLLCAFLWWATSTGQFGMTETKVLGINPYIKPLKFFLSTVIFVWSIGWYMGHLEASWLTKSFSWYVVVTFAFELSYIFIQAHRGETSHFNGSTPFHAMMFGLMGLAIGIMTFFTLVVAIQFFIQDLTHLPPAYLWGIRLGMILFVVFAFQGYVMGANAAHTIGAPDGGPGIALFNWSITHGDLRIAHFFGMHALQVLPLLGFYLIKEPKYVILIGSLYFVLACFLLWQALAGRPLFPGGI